MGWWMYLVKAGWWENLVQWYLTFEWSRNPIVDVEGPVPVYGSEDAGCFDLVIESPVLIPPGEIVVVDLPTKFFFTGVLVLVPRSGYARRGLTIINSPVQIDSDYTGTIGVVFYNLGKEPIIIEKKACQGWFEERIRRHFNPVDKINRVTKRGTGGFGSSGG